ncbi:sodium/proline symporter PutP [Corallincola platygyrae]|uniref:Sodium/proline symporter n=1 Tax=Corallincola platygyrae TaxID=1193278 RepID=A0ABW4XSD5_9GAMM
MQLDTPLLTTFIAYLIITLSLGVIAYKLTSNLSDYILGGRKLGPAVTALSVGASDMSGWLLMGLPGAVYLSGLNQAWIGIGLVAGAYINWLLVAGRLRTFTEKAGNSLTLPDFLEHRFNDSSGILRVVSAVTILVFFTLYVSSGMKAGAVLFEQVLNVPYTTALWVGALIIVGYTFVGGFLAVSWTDFFQGCLMLLALLIVPWVAIQADGGVSATWQALPPAHQDIWHETSLIGIVSLLAWGLGYFGQPHILARFMAIESAKHLPTARRISMSWMILSLIGALLVGLAAQVYFHDQPLENAETVFIVLSKTLLNPWVAGIIVAAILSAVMSTIDSQLLVSSSVVTEDFYRRWLRPEASDKELVWVGRGAVIAVSILAILLAADEDSTVLALVSYAWAGFGASFGPTLLLALFWRRYTKLGAITSLVSGALTVVIWKQLEGGLFDLYEIVPGFIIALLLGGLISKCSNPPSDSHQLFSSNNERSA